jgi:hypothetical protein
MELDKGQGVRSTGSQTRARSDEAKERDGEQTKNRRDEGSADRQMNERKVVIEQLSGAGRKRKRNQTGEEEGGEEANGDVQMEEARDKQIQFKAVCAIHGHAKRRDQQVVAMAQEAVAQPPCYGGRGGGGGQQKKLLNKNQPYRRPLPLAARSQTRAAQQRHVVADSQ